MTVTGVLDSDLNNEFVTLSNDPRGANYDSVDTVNVTLNVADSDSPGVRVAPTSLTVREGRSQTYRVALNNPPTATVTVDVTSDHAEVTVDKASLTFTTGNWGTEQTVTVSAAQDADTADDRATVRHAVTSGDPGYNGISVAAVNVTVDDDDSGGAPPQPPGGGGSSSGGGGGGGGAPQNRAPEFMEGDRTIRSVAENTPAGANIGEPVAASDFNRDALTFSLRGVGQLLTKAALDYETEASYIVFVWVQDNKDANGRADTKRDTVIRVALTVTNEDEPGDGRTVVVGAPMSTSRSPQP